MHNSNAVERVTISLPHNLAIQADTVRSDLNLSRSELYRVAMERFIQEHNSSRLSAIAAEMAEEYRANKDLTCLTALDGEDFA